MSSLPSRRMPDPTTTLAALIQRHQHGVWRYLRALGAEPHLAEDLTQETFLVAWRRGLEDQGDAPVAQFLRTTARQLFLRTRQKEGRREELLAELADRLWNRDCEPDGGSAWLAALAECTERLDDRTRQAVRACYGRGGADAGGDRSAIADSLGLRPNGLKTLLQRARALLRQCIESKLGGDS